LFEIIEKADYWGIGYALGYFGGVWYFGQIFMESWEQTILSLVLILGIAQKIFRKYF
jgi:hypothetical protein